MPEPHTKGDGKSPGLVRRVSRRGVSFDVINDGANHDFWGRFDSGAWEPETLQIFDSCVTPDTYFLDIGSWIGPTALYAASKARRVICLEPDPIAAEKLRWNIALNPSLVPKIEVIERALSRSDAPVVLGSRGQGGDSESSVWFAGARTTWTVPTIQPAELIRLVPPGPLFIKVDIEGSEYLIFPRSAGAWKRPQTTVLLSLHPKRISNASWLSRKLMTAGVFGALRSYSIASVDHNRVRPRLLLSTFNWLHVPIQTSHKNWLFERK